MSSLRVAVITPHFWPHTGDLEATTASVAEGLAELGVETTVLTASWGANWPRRLLVRGVAVERVSHAPLGGWSSFRYLTALHRWLRQHRGRLDVAYVMNLRLEAYATVGALTKSEVPVIVQTRGWGPGGDAWWQEHGRFGARAKEACLQASALVANTRLAADELAAAGYSPHRTHVIPWGVGLWPSRTPDLRLHARLALAEVNHDLAVAEYAPVALYVGRLDDFAGLSRLLDAWEPITRVWPSARLWLVGDGPTRERLRDQVLELDIRYQTFLPGSFEDRTDLFHAADVLVIPTTGNPQLQLEAMASGLPVLAADSPERRVMMVPGEHGWLLPATDIAGWTAAMSRLFESPRLAAEMGEAARSHVQTAFPRKKMAESIQRLCWQVRT